MVTKNKKIILELRKKFPEKVSVLVWKTQKCYVAEITDPAICKGGFTQANSFSELIVQINDCIQTVLEIPEKYNNQMPQYMPPLSLAQALNEFPKPELKESVQFSIIGERICV